MSSKEGQRERKIREEGGIGDGGGGGPIHDPPSSPNLRDSRVLHQVLPPLGPFPHPSSAVLVCPVFL
jgi:hypothetical protein